MLRNSKYLLALVLVVVSVFTVPTITSAAAADESFAVDIPVYNVTVMTEYLRALPEARNKIPVAVYQIEDKTGQHLEMESYTSMSKAVTQGATDMLIHALVQPKQFKVADRSIFQSIMTEQDLQGKRRLAPDETSPQINQLMGSKYIIAGAITEYGLTRTGGTKLKVDGKGGSTKGATAYAAIDIRVVDSSTNEAIYAISLRDDIMGTNVGGDVFSFFGKQLLIDFESGVGWQEPINMVIRRLVDAAVYELAVNFFADQSGIKDQLNTTMVARFNESLSQGAEVIDWDKKTSRTRSTAIFLLLLALGAKAVCQ